MHFRTSALGALVAVSVLAGCGADRDTPDGSSDCSRVGCSPVDPDGVCRARCGCCGNLDPGRADAGGNDAGDDAEGGTGEGDSG